jgi:hypothetical protein
VLLRERDRVLGHNRFSGRGMSRDEDGLVPLQTDDGLLLERVKFERPEKTLLLLFKSYHLNVIILNFC